MAKAILLFTIDYEGASLQLYLDLFWLTLQKRCHLERNIPCRWGFPFSLSGELWRLIPWTSQTWKQNYLIQLLHLNGIWSCKKGEELHLWDHRSHHLDIVYSQGPEGLSELQEFSFFFLANQI